MTLTVGIQAYSKDIGDACRAYHTGNEKTGIKKAA